MNIVRNLLRVLVIPILLLPNQANARIVSLPDYQEMLAKSDLVVIANPKGKTTETTEHSFLPNIWRQDKDGKTSQIESIGVETVFVVCAVLKGDTALKQFTLHHYREAHIPETELNGPGLVTFDPSRPTANGSYLLFLIRERDGRYAPVGGQTDPDLGSISPLPSSVH